MLIIISSTKPSLASADIAEIGLVFWAVCPGEIELATVIERNTTPAPSACFRFRRNHSEVPSAEPSSTTLALI